MSRKPRRRRRGTKPGAAAGDPVRTRKLVAWIAELTRADFQRSGNPLYAMAAFKQLRRNKAPIPEWLLEFFDGLLRDQAALVSIRWQGKFETEQRDITLAGEVELSKNAPEPSKWAARIEEIAAEYGVKPATVRKAFERFGHLVTRKK